MDTRDMVVEIVYENKDGLFLLQIGEGVNKRFNTHITTRDVEQVIKKNPKLFLKKTAKLNVRLPSSSLIKIYFKL